jgi:hypothetical protein
MTPEHFDNWLYADAVETYDKPITLAEGPTLDRAKAFSPNFVYINELPNGRFEVKKNIRPKR